VASAIEEYIDQLGSALRGPRHTKADLLTEARDSLHDAAAAYEHAGLSRRSAERRAVADFGAVPEIAPGYQTELAITQSRRTALLMLLVVGLQPLLWQEWWPWVAANHDHVGGLPFMVVNESIEWLGAATIAAALLALFALSMGGRYIETASQRALARLVGRGALVLCGALTCLGVALCVFSPHRTLATGLMLLTPFLLLPLSAVAGAARRCLTLT
jgi:hypothetical protein